MKKRVLIAISALVIAVLACGQYVGTPTPTNSVANSTPNSHTATTNSLVIPEKNTNSPETPLVTPLVTVLVVTATPPNSRCVSASEAVYLRPSPSDQNYPIASLPNGSVVILLGGKSGDWLYVRFGSDEGWVYSKYLKGC